MKPKNRLQRVHKNGSKKKNLKNLIKFPLGPARDKRIERDKAHETAARIYTAWAHDFVNRRKTPHQIVDSINDLGVQLDNAIKDREFMDFIWKEMIFPAMQTAEHLANIVTNAKVKVQTFCSGCNTLIKHDVFQKAWLLRQFKLKCECGHMTEGEDCRLVKEKK